VSVVLTLAAFVLAAGYIGGSRWVRPWHLLTLAGLSFAGTLFDLQQLSVVHQIRDVTQLYAPEVDVTWGIGPSIALVGSPGGAGWRTRVHDRLAAPAPDRGHEPGALPYGLGGRDRRGHGDGAHPVARE
jgi:hypothetical protein